MREWVLAKERVEEGLLQKKDARFLLDEERSGGFRECRFGNGWMGGSLLNMCAGKEWIGDGTYGKIGVGS